MSRFYITAIVSTLLVSALTSDAAATGPYTVPSVYQIEATIPAGLFSPPVDANCLVRSETTGVDVAQTLMCYSVFGGGAMPPPPPPPFEPVIHDGISGVLDPISGELVAALVDCEEIIPGLLGLEVEFTIQLEKGGGPATGSVVLTTDITAPLDCVAGTETTGPFTMTALAQGHDEDLDGCADWEELGDSEALGGLRDPFNFWDFYDVNHDGAVDLFNDVFGVSAVFGLTGDPTGDPLAPQPPQPAYHTAFDRGAVVGPDAWNVYPADGTIDLFNDIFGVSLQFGHNCQAAP